MPDFQLRIGMLFHRQNRVYTIERMLPDGRLALPAMTISVKRKWDNQRVFTRQGMEMYDVMELRNAAKMILQQFKSKIH